MAIAVAALAVIFISTTLDAYRACVLHARRGIGLLPASCRRQLSARASRQSNGSMVGSAEASCAHFARLREVETEVIK